MKSFLFANVPLSVVHFVLFVLIGGFSDSRATSSLAPSVHPLAA